MPKLPWQTHLKDLRPWNGWCINVRRRANGGSADDLVDKAVWQRKWRRVGGSLAVSLFFGVGLLVAGILLVVAFNGTPNTVAWCNGQRMGPDSTCQVYVDGTLRGTYSQQQMLAGEQPDKAQDYVWGIAAITAGALITGLGLAVLRPGRPWGKALSHACPRCGKQDLREKYMSVSERDARRGRRTWRTYVVLCTDACGYVNLHEKGQPVPLG